MYTTQCLHAASRMHYGGRLHAHAQATWCQAPPLAGCSRPRDSGATHEAKRPSPGQDEYKQYIPDDMFYPMHLLHGLRPRQSKFCKRATCEMTAPANWPRRPHKPPPSLCTSYKQTNGCGKTRSGCQSCSKNQAPNHMDSFSQYGPTNVTACFTTLETSAGLPNHAAMPGGPLLPSPPSGQAKNHAKKPSNSSSLEQANRTSMTSMEHTHRTIFDSAPKHVPMISGMAARRVPPSVYP